MSAHTPGPLTAIPKPPPSLSDHGWRAIAMCGSQWMLAAPSNAVLQIKDNTVIGTRWDHEANAKRLALCWNSHDGLLAALRKLHDDTAVLITHLQATDRLRPCFNLAALGLAQAAIEQATGATR